MSGWTLVCVTRYEHRPVGSIPEPDSQSGSAFRAEASAEWLSVHNCPDDGLVSEMRQHVRLVGGVENDEVPSGADAEMADVGTAQRLSTAERGGAEHGFHG